MDRRSDHELIGAIAHGDGSALRTLRCRYTPVVFAFHRGLVGDPAVAHDLAAETFASVLLECVGYAEANVTAGPWLLGIAGDVVSESLDCGAVRSRVRESLEMEFLFVGTGELAGIETLADAERGAPIPLHDETRAAFARLTRNVRGRGAPLELRLSSLAVRSSQAAATFTERA